MTQNPRQSTDAATGGDAATGANSPAGGGGPISGRPGAVPPRTVAPGANESGTKESGANESGHQSSDKAGGSAGTSYHHYPFYSPRFWHGMRPLTWLRLLRSGRFRIHPTRYGMLIGVTLATPMNTLLGWCQNLWYRRRLAEAELHGPPVFIVGHWRSGTTLLHELMVRDERLSSPSTFQCFAPHHFLISEWFFHRFASWLLPGKRPMDNMAAGWDRPQEDEFALLNLGLPSPYRRMAFPNEGPVDLQYLNFDGVPPADQRRWLATLRRFLLTVSTATGRPLIIKSPTHTGRIAYLASEFPDAKFIHITRDPRELYPSTVRLWRGLDEVQALQKPKEADLEDYVIECFQRMYGAFESQRQQVSSQRLIDVRYEDLIADPVATLQRIYETLRLSDFETVKPVIEDWIDSEHRQYQPNRHRLDPDSEARIRAAWNDYFVRYGYGD